MNEEWNMEFDFSSKKKKKVKISKLDQKKKKIIKILQY